MPVWNKSNREHLIVGSRAVGDPGRPPTGRWQSWSWDGEYLLDADHINLATVDRYVPHCDFFTIDVADAIGTAADPYRRSSAFIGRHPELIGPVWHHARRSSKPPPRQFLAATHQAGEIYRHILRLKGGVDDFVTEVSMDETDNPQSPAEMLIILAALADEQIPAQTIAPKFTGRFNKGVDYEGDLAQFEREFDADLEAIALAIESLWPPGGTETLRPLRVGQVLALPDHQTKPSNAAAPGSTSRRRAPTGSRRSSAWPNPAAAGSSWQRRSTPRRWRSVRRCASPTPP